MKIILKRQENVLLCHKNYIYKLHIHLYNVTQGVNIIMKNKFVKILSTGVCCIIVSVLLSSYLPQNNKIALTTISTHETSIIASVNIDPPYH